MRLVLRFLNYPPDDPATGEHSIAVNKVLDQAELLVDFGQQMNDEYVEKTIQIMADFGFGPYAWLKDSSDQADYAGLKIANRKTGITEFRISKKLETDFAKWIDHFERKALDNPGFDWESFHQEGIHPSMRLKQEFQF
ncbi:MAG: hypothetical protein HQM08_01585 [Candidatus Riflebacteria bacterium]|nr:hypothetical protein [Candidatus Riflebacteria bacterium]